MSTEFFLAIRNALTRVLNTAKDFLADPAKNMNKLTKDEKVIEIERPCLMKLVQVRVSR